MAKHRKKENRPAPEPQFRTSPFLALKGVKLAPEEKLPQPAEKQEKKMPSEDDGARLFLQAMAGVRQIGAEISPGKKKHIEAVETGAAKAEESLRKKLPREEAAARKTFLKELERLKLDVRFEDSIPDEEIKPLSGNRLRQIKRGIVDLDRQLDLHGLTREEALDSLQEFLEAARRAGEKAVLVITGKGNRSDGPPVLQQSVAGWLREKGRAAVIEYAPAPKEFGGSGAFVVFLRPLDKVVVE